MIPVQNPCVLHPLAPQFQTLSKLSRHQARCRTLPQCLIWQMCPQGVRFCRTPFLFHASTGPRCNRFLTRRFNPPTFPFTLKIPFTDVAHTGSRRCQNEIRPTQISVSSHRPLEIQPNKRPIFKFPCSRSQQHRLRKRHRKILPIPPRHQHQPNKRFQYPRS